MLFSHLADSRSVCITELVAFAKRCEDFKKLNTELIGLSVDNVLSHIKWVEWIKKKLGIEILLPITANPRGEIASKLGLLHAQSSTLTVRAMTIADSNGIIRAVLFYPQEIGCNVDEILRLLKALQIANRYGVALQANSPDNEIVGERAIVSPAISIEEAKERVQSYQCFY